MSNTNNSGSQQSGAGVITSMTNDTRTFSHTGNEVGEGNVELLINAPESDNAPILKWTMPKKFRQVVYAGGNHVTKGVLRCREDFEGHSGTTVSLEASIQPTAGHEDIEDQPFPTAVVANVDTGNELSIADVNYAQNEIELASDPGGANIAVWPAITEGVIKYVAENQFNHSVGPLDKWGVPVHVLSDFKQNRKQTELHLVGAGRFRRSEALVMTLNSPRKVVWEDEDYPNGVYASKLEQRVDVQV